MNAEKDEATVKQDAPSSNSVPPGDPRDDLAEMSAELSKSEKASAQSNTPPQEDKTEKK